MNPLRIGTRASPLALWQAEHVRGLLLARDPFLAVELVPMTTTGDQELAAPLHQIGGKGLFVKEIESALLAHEVDLAVHSMKDVPAMQPNGLELAAILEREDVRDAFISSQYENEIALPKGARIGSSSLRRRAQLLHRRPDLQVEDLRGNVATRLAKLDSGQYDAIILAAAGLKRLGMEERIRSFFAVEDSLPAVGQGAIGIEIRTDDENTRALVLPLTHQETSLCVRAERAMNRKLGGDCRLPVAALAHWENESLHLEGRVVSPDGKTVLRARGSGTDPSVLGEKVAEDLLQQGAGKIIQELQPA
ncbi:hydroxymethylbilane synthase [Acidithiobacillus sp. IBUN Pt1247-S3]|uniref:hydroxymethylbilane synthase n=1 Tax=Acidithiobacillus sp. IBUN Pt1247-S3 TaxID=3166642 RepID=UPI0034E3C785